MPVTEIIDKNYNPKDSHSHTMSILPREDGLSFCVQRKTDKYIEAFRNESFSVIANKSAWVDKIAASAKASSVKQIACNNATLVSSSTKVTLIPEEHFSKESIKQQFELCCEIDSLDEIHYQKAESINAYVCFTVNSEISNLFLKKHPQLTYTHLCLSLIRPNEENSCLRIHIDNNRMFVVYFNNRQLQLLTALAYSSTNDLVYNLLNIIKQFDISKSTQVMVSGNISRYDTKYILLHKFIENISLYNTSGIKGPISLTNAIKQEFSPLFELL